VYRNQISAGFGLHLMACKFHPGIPRLKCLKWVGISIRWRR